MSKPEVSKARRRSLLGTQRNRSKRPSSAVVTGLVVLVAIFLIFLRSPATAATAKHYTDLTFPPLPDIQVPDYGRYQLKNGIVVYLMEDHELPLIRGTALFHTGSRLEPATQVGLAEITGAVLRTGGTRSHPADVLNQLLEQQAAAVEANIGLTQGKVSFDVLSEDLEPVFRLFAEVIQEPAFAPDKIALAKLQQQGQIARRNDDPDAVASREFRKLIYGDNSPYARTVEYATLENITREDVVRFYQQSFRPNSMILGIVGDFEPQQMRSLVQEQFGDWTAAPQQRPGDPPPVTQATRKGVFLIDQPQLSQSYIRLGHLGGQQNDPDFPTLGVLNEILNGLGGRLVNRVRSRQGLAYTVFGVWSARLDYPGLFTAGGQTRSETSVPFIQAVQAEIERIRTEPISPEELKFAQDSVLNSFVFNFQDPSQTLSRLIQYEYYGYPKDFIFRYRRDVEATTTADVQRVAQEHLQPERLVTLVVGHESEIQPPLRSLGPETNVTAIDITIPDPPPS